jgi:hypothetical protein
MRDTQVVFIKTDKNLSVPICDRDEIGESFVESEEGEYRFLFDISVRRADGQRINSKWVLPGSNKFVDVFDEFLGHGSARNVAYGL